MKRVLVPFATTFVILALVWPAAAADGNPERGQRVYGACAPCHSLEPNRNMTGPSLAELWNRKAGTLASFTRYSPALKSSDVVWNDKSLDEWIDDPQHFIPGNQMTFPGIKNAQQRADLLAFLRSATAAGRAPSVQSAQGRGQMMGMMGGAVPNLKKLDPEGRVQKIARCGDTYKVTTADGKTRDFWERNLRFKTDVSEDGPEKGTPALVPAGMMGDRADVIFASPDEISGSITKSC
jgi:cytochrome c